MCMYVSEICAEGIFVTFPWWLENVKSRSKIALFSNERHFEIWFPKKRTITFFWSKLSKLHKKDPILHVATTFSIKQGETRTSHGPIPHPLINCIGCQSVKESCVRLCCMCTNPWKGSLPSTFKTALLLKGVLRVLWEQAPLAAPVLLFLSRRNVLGIELSPWLPHGCGTFYLWVSGMPLVNSHSNQCSRIIFFLDCFSICFLHFICCYNFHALALGNRWKRAI